MQTDVPAKPRPNEWLPTALIFCVVAVALRLLALAFDGTDLFVDEVQYWFWGQNLDFGYYSKPPLIGWLIRGVTDLVGSDAAFWVRMPGTLLHALTALLLGGVAARFGGHKAALWTVALYLTLPFTALGSVMISTDTVMAPSFAAALLCFFHLADHRRARDAVLTGLFAGLAFMAKYAGMYFLIGMALVLLTCPSYRIGWRNLALILVAFALVIAPNVIWNLNHDLTTVSHTMDNAGWVREGAAFNLGSLAEFFLSQFGVFGPITFAALLWGYLHAGREPLRALILFSIPALVIVCVQALLDQAYANWAIATYFAGTVLAVLMLPRWGRIAALVVNLVLALALPLLIVLSSWPSGGGDGPLLKRYLGRHALSESILALAQAENLPVVSGNRDILADLFYIGRSGDVPLYATPERGRASSYYAQTRALPPEVEGEVLLISSGSTNCPGPELGGLTLTGHWQGREITARRVQAACLRGL